MATIEEIVRDIRASVPTEAGGLVIAKWLDNRYKEMMSKVKFRHLRKIGELVLPAVISTGTVTTTRGSTTVTGTGTAFQTDMSAGAQEYYYFRTNTAWYKISSVTNETTLVLDSAFAEADVTDGAYRIVKRHHTLAATSRWIGDFYCTRLRKRLNKVNLDELDILFPGRELVGNIPSFVAQIGNAENDAPLYEIYPPPQDSEIIHYIYWELPTALTMASSIPTVIDSYSLKEGALIDLYRFEKIKSLQRGNIEQAAVYRNDEKAQETKWMNVIKDAIRTSRGSDDLTIILEMFHGTPRSAPDQRTARDYIIDNWSR